MIINSYADYQQGLEIYLKKSISMNSKYPLSCNYEFNRDGEIM